MSNKNRKITAKSRAKVILPEILTVPSGNPQSGWAALSDAMDFFGVKSKTTYYALAKKGFVPPTRNIGRAPRVSWEEIHDYDRRIRSGELDASMEHTIRVARAANKASVAARKARRDAA